MILLIKDFWFLIRASNTQNCLVFRLEHFNKDNFKKEINKLIKNINTKNVRKYFLKYLIQIMANNGKTI